MIKPKAYSEHLHWRVICLHFLQNKSVKEISNLSDSSIETCIKLHWRYCTKKNQCHGPLPAMSEFEVSLLQKRAPWYYRFFLWLCCHMSDYQEVGFVEKDAPCSVRVMWTEVVRIILRIWSKYVGNHWWDCIRLLKFNEKVWLQPSWNDPYDPPAHDKRMSAIGVLTICEIEDSYIKEGSW